MNRLGEDRSWHGMDRTGAVLERAEASQKTTGAGQKGTKAVKERTGAGQERTGAGQVRTGAGQERTRASQKNVVGEDRNCPRENRSRPAEDRQEQAQNRLTLDRRGLHIHRGQEPARCHISSGFSGRDHQDTKARNLNRGGQKTLHWIPHHTIGPDKLCHPGTIHCLPPVPVPLHSNQRRRRDYRTKGEMSSSRNSHNHSCCCCARQIFQLFFIGNGDVFLLIIQANVQNNYFVQLYYWKRSLSKEQSHYCSQKCWHETSKDKSSCVHVLCIKGAVQTKYTRLYTSTFREVWTPLRKIHRQRKNMFTLYN